MRLAASLAIGPDGGPYSAGYTPGKAGAGSEAAAAQITHPAFAGLLGTAGADLPDAPLTASAAAAAAASTDPSSAAPAPARTLLAVNPENLKRAWETATRSTKEDWQDWMRRLSVELLRESPSPALRSCCPLAQVCWGDRRYMDAHWHRYVGEIEDMDAHWRRCGPTLLPLLYYTPPLLYFTSPVGLPRSCRGTVQRRLCCGVD